MTFAMNRTVISGTPRISSMNMTQNILITGRLDLRPSASRMPTGSDTAIPTKERISVTMRPPQSGVSTSWSPKTPPCSRKKAITGKATKSARALSPL